MRSLHIFDEWDGGFSWRPEGEGPMQRACHALIDEGRVWVIDPIDIDGIDERIKALGEPAAVVMLLDRHTRDCVTIAQRFEIPLLVPPGRSSRLRGLGDDVDVQVLGDSLPQSSIEVIPLHRIDGVWLERALWWPERKTLVVAEVLGTHDFGTAPGEILGVHPTLRLSPPKRLLEYEPERIIVGHGCVVADSASELMRDAIKNSRRFIPRYMMAFPKQVWSWRSARRHARVDC